MIEIGYNPKCTVDFGPIEPRLESVNILSAANSLAHDMTMITTGALYASEQEPRMMQIDTITLSPMVGAGMDLDIRIMRSDRCGEDILANFMVYIEEFVSAWLGARTNDCLLRCTIRAVLIA